MNCDQVFEILTRGPFPSGDRSDRAVELHLADCPECQRLANALRPAIELFQEALSGDEGRELPGYWGGMIDESEEIVARSRSTQMTCRLPGSLQLRFDRGRRWVSAKTGGSGLRFAAAMLVGVALGAVVWTAGVPARDDWSDQNRLAVVPSTNSRATLDSPQTSSSIGNWSNNPGLNHVAETRITLHLSAACLTDLSSGTSSTAAPGGSLSLAELARLNCCTRCHHAQAEKSLPQATASVAHSCEICHR